MQTSGPLSYSLPSHNPTNEHHIIATGYIASNNALGNLSSNELSRKFGGNPLGFETWRIRVCQGVIDKNVKPKFALEYILGQSTGRVKEVIISMASIEFNTSWELIIEIMGELKHQFALDQPIKTAIEAEKNKFLWCLKMSPL